MAAVIGALRADLSASIAQFEDDMRKAGQAIARFGRDAQRTGQQIQQAGQTMTVALTAPLVAFMALTGRTAGNFEAAMNRVQVATQASAAEVGQLRAQARAFGDDRRFTATATEAANAMESLAKNGLSTADILGGAARATLTLAAATGASLDQSADVATSAMQQFHHGAGQLTDDVNQITGTLLASRLDFNGYSEAIGQAGGVAGSSGVNFREFNAVLAGTAANFSGGSDAGTSFKTFLSRLIPQGAEARRTMAQLGISFYDSNHNMRSMADIAQILHDRLSILTPETRDNALQIIFGNDARRTAVGLMDLQRDGILRLERQIAGSNAEEQMAVRTQGLNGAFTNLRKALESLMIAIGDSGLLQWLTQLVQGVTEFVGSLSRLPAPVLAFASAMAGLVAIIGPALVAIGFMVQGLGNLAVIAPIAGVAVGGLLRVLLVLIASPVGPWLIVLGVLLGVVIQKMIEMHQPTQAVTAAVTALNAATAAYATAATAAAGASGQAREAALREAAAKRELAIQARNAAAAQLTLARATIAVIQAENARAINSDRFNFRGDRPGTILPALNAGRATQAQASADAAGTAITAADAQIAQADAAIHAGDQIVRGLGRTGTNVANLGQTAAHAGHEAENAARRISRANRELTEGLQHLDEQTRYGLNSGRPQSDTQAEELSNRLRDLEERARDAGVATARFAGTIAMLRARITTLHAAAQAREVQDFANTVAEADDEVARFANGGLTPMEEATHAVVNQFNQLRGKLRDLIDANAALAAESPAAARALAGLQTLYDGLAESEAAAGAAAIHHVEALAALARVQSQLDQARTRNQITDARTARGDFGAASSAVSAHAAATRDLEQSRLQAQHDLMELEDRRFEANRRGNAEEVANLDAQIVLARQYYDVVRTTSADQILAQQRLQALVSAYEDAVKGSISDLIDGLLTQGRSFDFKAWAKDFVGKITRAVADNWAQGITDSIMNALGIGRRMQVQTIQAGQIITNGVGGAGAGPGGAGGGNVVGQIVGAVTGGNPIATAVGNQAGSWIAQAASAVFHMLPGFANGGAFKVGGAGGVDSQLVAFKATPGEPVHVGDAPQARSNLNVNISLDGASGDDHIRQIAYTAAAQGSAVAIDQSRRALPGAALHNDLLGTP